VLLLLVAPALRKIFLSREAKAVAIEESVAAAHDAGVP
jgi:cobalt-zinc-cadmium resistance protein CzcA